MCTLTYKIININHLESGTRKINFDPVYSSYDAEFSLNYLISCLQDAIANNTSITNVPSRFKSIKLWVIPGLVLCIRHRDKEHLNAKLASDDHRLSTINKRYRNFCNKLLKNLKLQYEQSELHKLLW